MVNKKSKKSWDIICESTLKEQEKKQKKSKSKKKGKTKNIVRYELGDKFNGIYFSKREAECMVCLLNGNTILRTAKKLELSPRTIEYYVLNMKRKLNCNDKFELVEKVSGSNFLKNFNLAKQSQP